MPKILDFKHLRTVDAMMEAFPLIAKHYDFDVEYYRESLEEMTSLNGYKMVAFYLDGRLVGVCGYWILRMLYCGRYLQISNLVIDEKMRGKGIGKQVLKYFEDFAIKTGCAKIVLDSYAENKKSHSLYFAQGFYIRGLHFMKDL